MKKVLFFLAAICIIVACNNGTPLEQGCTLLPASDGLYNLKTAEGKKLKVKASSIKFYYDTFFRIVLQDGKQRFYVPATNYLSEPYEDVLYAGGGQFVVTYILGNNKYKSLISIWGDEDICLMDDIFVFFSQEEQKYYYITSEYKQDLFEMWNSFHYYDDAGNDRFQVVRGYPCRERSLTDRLEYGKPSQYETGLITVDYPGF